MAFKVHGQNVSQEGTADIAEHRLVRAFLPLLGSKDKADVVVGYIEKRAGLLVGQGEKDGEAQFAFPHRTFQEFLAACHLAARDDFAEQCARLAQAAPAHWQLVLPLAARLAKAERGASAADELIGGCSIQDFRRQPTAADWNCALLAGAQLLEIGLGAINKRPRTQAIAARVAGWLAALLPVHPDDGGLSAKLRAQAGDVLAALGDPRFDPQRFFLPVGPDLGFVRITADPAFKIGTRRRDFERAMEAVGASQGNRGFFQAEINDEPTPTRKFYIARYLVTVAQFRRFVEATGFELGDEDALRDPDSRPVRYVNWHEALAYCGWLNEVLKDAPGFGLADELRAGRLRVALPSELEWEKAARGGLEGKIFPWGDGPDANLANYGESGIGTTSATGCFPPNAYGLHDMVGNVWEWTRSLWGKDWEKPDFNYPYQMEDSKRENLKAGNEVFRVVRGGSWYVTRDGARCAVRGRLQPDDRSDLFGFRVVFGSPPVP